jgi:hypothetical protein
MKGPRLKMFVWEHVLTDHKPGMMVALARDVEEARREILKACDYVPEEDLAKEPQVVEAPAGFVCWGGG